MTANNSLTIDLDKIPNKNTVKLVSPDKDGNFEIITITDGEFKNLKLSKAEALEIAQFIIKYL